MLYFCLQTSSRLRIISTGQITDNIRTCIVGCIHCIGNFVHKSEINLVWEGHSLSPMVSFLIYFSKIISLRLHNRETCL